MINFNITIKSTNFSRVFVSYLILCFCAISILPPNYVYSQTPINLTLPGTMVQLSPSFEPMIMKGIRTYPENPLKFDFIVDKGELSRGEKEIAYDGEKLIKYFLASLTVPEEDLWVNLSPYEKDRIVPEGFGVTEMGRDLLAQDYLLKQITASLMYPEDEIGQNFWTKVYEDAYEKYGITDVPMDTFNKVWIVPDKAVVYTHGDRAFVVESRLKVMTDVDYKAMNNNRAKEGFASARNEVGGEPLPYSNSNNISASIVREIIIPKIEKEVNEGKNFVMLRQIYNSMLLATWYKRNLKESVFGKIYVDKDKVEGIDIEDKDAKHKIYNQYLDAFKKGVYNYIKEEYDPVSMKMLPKKYFSGGVDLAMTGNETGFSDFEFRETDTVDPSEFGSDDLVVLRTGMDLEMGRTIDNVRDKDGTEAGKNILEADDETRKKDTAMVADGGYAKNRPYYKFNEQKIAMGRLSAEAEDLKASINNLGENGYLDAVLDALVRLRRLAKDSEKYKGKRIVFYEILKVKHLLIEETLRKLESDPQDKSSTEYKALLLKFIGLIEDVNFMNNDDIDQNEKDAVSSKIFSLRRTFLSMLKKESEAGELTIEDIAGEAGILGFNKADVLYLGVYQELSGLGVFVTPEEVAFELSGEDAASSLSVSGIRWAFESRIIPLLKGFFDISIENEEDTVELQEEALAEIDENYLIERIVSGNNLRATLIRSIMVSTGAPQRRVVERLEQIEYSSQPGNGIAKKGAFLRPIFSIICLKTTRASLGTFKNT